MPVQYAPCPVNTNTTVGAVAAFRDVATLRFPKPLETENNLCDRCFLRQASVKAKFPMVEGFSLRYD